VLHQSALRAHRVLAGVFQICGVRWSGLAGPDADESQVGVAESTHPSSPGLFQ
jgi:hypothetical protein